MWYAKGQRTGGDDMISFVNDYSEGACDEILRAMIETNHTQTPGYGLDAHCEQAAELIRKACGTRKADVHFLVGGTQCNKTLIAAALRPHEAVICADTGHINVHETGAVENSGHKVIALRADDGKVRCSDIEQAVKKHTDEHMVKPKMVYLSNATELGTFYTKQELSDIWKLCRRLGLYLFVDGARLGNALCAQGNDLTLKEMAKLCDVFYIGGTKNGALFGEALVILNDELKPDFRYHIKQNGGMLAKGRLLGIQFEVLFSSELYWRNAMHANAAAQKIAAHLKAEGVQMLIESATNQIFPIFADDVLKKLSGQFELGTWEKVDERHTAIRIVTSWDTSEKAVRVFNQAVSRYLHP